MPITAEKKTDKYRIRVLDRTFDLLDALAESEYPMGTADLCKRAHLSKSTVHRLLTVLEGAADGGTGRREPPVPPRVQSRRTGTLFPSAGSVDGTQIFLEELARKTGGTARVGVRRMYEQISLVLSSGVRAEQLPRRRSDADSLYRPGKGDRCF